MATYRIDLAREAAKSLSSLDRTTRALLNVAIEALATDPRPSGTCKLAGGAGEWSIRVGYYRVVYEIHDGRLLILVIRVAHRREVYL